MRSRSLLAIGWREVVAILSTTAVVGACGIAAQSPGSGATSTPQGTSASTPTAAATATSAATAAGSPTATSGATATATAGATPTAAGSPTAQPTLANHVDWANWPLYIDIDDNGKYPTLEKFTQETGITVNYKEAINDNSEFFGVIQPDLAANHSIGYDVITPSDWMVAKLIRLGYLQPLDKSQLPNWNANAQPLFQNPWYDPGNVYSVAWQSGIVGIGYNPKLTHREITKFDDLLDPAFKGNVGMFSEMIDTMSMTLLSLGIDPHTATDADAQQAQQKLLAASQAGQFQKFYGNDYYDALAGNNVALTMAWSGDISQMQLYDNPNVKFVVPSDGGMLFVDNMVLPKVVEHPADAYKLMDYWYSLEAAVPLTEYIGYYSPVKGVREQVLADSEAARADDPEWADQLLQIAHDSFPDPDQMTNIHQYPILDETRERTWNDLFAEVVNG
jgi:spermidine/putrescine transport system substrate-binding protein